MPRLIYRLLNGPTIREVCATVTVAKLPFFADSLKKGLMTENRISNSHGALQIWER